ncbi:Bromodomain containing protein [Tritrichomonas foetus]|uniref:Bromodomain containing protein n=1 Tax=Tritrichomonas foetus TaxID=1144522 RepID=A0A1J4L6V2_9EUKA|nr:Bromodomain containing protein [Tritrichomonas foetus]|eukprot:OHT17677.1 Bromodomain containing protein [Tritrichomonas foetus]
MSNSSQTPKTRKQYTFTYYQANVQPPPKIILKYTPTNNPVPQRVTFTAKKPSTPAQPKKPPPTGLARILNDIWKKVSQRDTQKIFAYPVTEDIAPGYFNVVKHPIDLSVIKAKLHDDEYQTLQQFRDDMRLMFTNCLTYNPKTTYVYQQGEILFQFFRRQMKLAKKQLLGNNQQTMSSLTRTISEGAQDQRESIESMDIPVVIDEVTKPHFVKPSFPPQADGTISCYYINNPSGASASSENSITDGSIERFDSFCDILRQTPKLQNKLKTLKDRYPHVINDAVRQIAGIDETFTINESMVNAAINAEITNPKPGAIAIGEAPVPDNYIDQLSASMPELPLDSIRPHVASVDELREQNLRLMLFYNNSLQHWKGADLVHGKQKVMDKIKENITKITMSVPPSTLVKTHEHNILQHIIYSIAAT